MSCGHTTTGMIISQRCTRITRGRRLSSSRPYSATAVPRHRLAHGSSAASDAWHSGRIGLSSTQRLIAFSPLLAKFETMSLIQFLTEIPTELRLEILNLAGGKAAANLSLTCQAAKELIQSDDKLWTELGKEELCDIRKRMGYEEYVKKARSRGWCCSMYGWFRHIVTNCCTVCLWFCPNGLVKYGKIRLCTDCERDIRAYEKMYDV